MPRWSPLGVTGKFKISDEHPCLFHMGVPHGLSEPIKYKESHAFATFVPVLTFLRALLIKSLHAENYSLAILQIWAGLFKAQLYTCQLFLIYKREIFILGVLGFLKTFSTIISEDSRKVRSLPKKSEVFRRRLKSSEVLGRV